MEEEICRRCCHWIASNNKLSGTCNKAGYWVSSNDNRDSDTANPTHFFISTDYWSDLETGPRFGCNQWKKIDK